MRTRRSWDSGRLPLVLLGSLLESREARRIEILPRAPDRRPRPRADREPATGQEALPARRAARFRTPLERAAPADLTFWINGEPAAAGTVRRTVPAVFTASETLDVGMDTGSQVADAYFDEAPFAFEGTLKRLHFRNLPAGEPEFPGLPDD